MDLIRELMLKLETHPVPETGIEWLAPDQTEIQVVGYSTQEIGYHLALLEQAGFVDTDGADVRVRHGVPGIAFSGLSWAGHDFLDAVRSPVVWRRTKEVASAAGGFTVDLLLSVAKSLLEGAIRGAVKGLIGG
nr:DUF2513 domain-containing protein [Burkholderia ambifaria]